MKFTLNAIAAFALVHGSALAQQTEAPVMTPGNPAAAVPGAAGAPQPPPAWINFALIGGMVFFMWLFVIRPQAKRQKEHKKFLDALQAGTEVITSGGLIGKVTSVSDNIVTVDLGASTVRVLKSAISGTLQSGVATQPAK